MHDNVINVLTNLDEMFIYIEFIHICKYVNNIVMHSILSIAMDFISIYVWIHFCLSKHGVVSFMRFNEDAII
jgi:hypothetical protein